MGSVSATTSSPFYSTSCEALACLMSAPVISGGASAADECSCFNGYAVSILTTAPVLLMDAFAMLVMQDRFPSPRVAHSTVCHAQLYFIQ